MTHAISMNPANGEILQRYPFDSDAQLDRTLADNFAAFKQWRYVDLSQRAAVMSRMTDVLRQMSEPLARMITAEMGKPITQARAEVEKCAGLCQWYAEHGPALLAPEATQVPDRKARIEYRPLGPVLAVMPWNFPLWQVLRGAVPVLLAGNGYLLKPAPNVMGSAMLLHEAFAEAGVPQGLFGVLNVEPAGVSRAIADRRVAAVTVTGSVAAGSAIAAQAGAALKKCVLELGGCDPFIVLADADLDEAVNAALLGRFQNTGQVCAAAKRLIVESSILPAFIERFLAATRALKVGDPQLADTCIGPMARHDLRDELHGQVQNSIAQGAQLLLGGHPLAGPGNYYAPTVLGNVQPGMTAFDEELFGPVASIIEARDAHHALELANDSEFGLSATLWSHDAATIEYFTERLETGAVFINGYSASDARVGFGGIKKSGFGRELSHFGLREFCNAQTIWLDRR